MTNTENPGRRQEDQHPSEPLQWDTKQPLIDAARAHLAQERATAGVVPVPHTNPQQFIAIGTAIEIGGLLPEGFGTSATGQVAAAVRALLLELTTFSGKMVSGNHLAQRAAGILGLQQAAAQEDEQEPEQTPEQAGRFDRVTPQPDGSFQHSYRGKPVAGPGPAGSAARASDPVGYLANEQIAAGAAIKCEHGQPIGRNVAIDVFDAMKQAVGQEGGAA